METALQRERPPALAFLADPKLTDVEKDVLGSVLESVKLLNDEQDLASSVRAGTALARAYGTCSLRSASQQFQEMMRALKLDLSVYVQPDAMDIYWLGSQYSRMHAMMDALRAKRGAGEAPIDAPDVSGITFHDDNDRKKLQRALEVLQFLNRPQGEQPAGAEARLALLRECRSGVQEIYSAAAAADEKDHAKAHQSWKLTAEYFARGQVRSEAMHSDSGFRLFLQTIGVILYARRQHATTDGRAHVDQILSWMTSRKRELFEARKAARIRSYRAEHRWYAGFLGGKKIPDKTKGRENAA